MTLRRFLGETRAAATGIAAVRLTGMTIGGAALVSDHAWIVDQRDVLKAAADAEAAGDWADDGWARYPTRRVYGVPYTCYGNCTAPPTGGSTGTFTRGRVHARRPDRTSNVKGMKTNQPLDRAGAPRRCRMCGHPGKGEFDDDERNRRCRRGKRIGRSMSRGGSAAFVRTNEAVSALQYAMVVGVIAVANIGGAGHVFRHHHGRAGNDRHRGHGNEDWQDQGAEVGPDRVVRGRRCRIAGPPGLQRRFGDVASRERDRGRAVRPRSRRPDRLSRRDRNQYRARIRETAPASRRRLVDQIVSSRRTTEDRSQ